MREKPSLKIWEIIERKLIADGSPWIKFYRDTVRLPDGKIVDDYYTIDQADYVEIFALLDDRQVIGLWHYKHGTRRIVLGLPAGYLEPGESPLEAAKRELFEEAGYEADTWIHLGSFANDGNRGMGQAHIFLACGLRQVTEPNDGDLEENLIEYLSVEEMRRHLAEGDVATMGSGMGIALALNYLGKSGF